MRRILAALALLLAVVLAVVLAVPVHAVEPDEILQDPALESRARRLSAGLRCLVCQNQSIDDSNAPLARDLRLLVRERLKQGDSDAAVLDFVVDRYGTFVLLKPPLSAGTIILWLAPVVLLGLGLLLALGHYRRRAASPAAPADLSPEEQERLARLLKDNP